MKPLKHPVLADITVEGILHALGDPVRVRIFSDIARAECPKICASFVNIQGKVLAKSTLSHHFNVLREAGLIRSVRQGVELHNTTRCSELQARFGLMIQAIVESYAKQERALKRRTKKSK